ncbi:hypothetical protein FFONT_1318 [Fervidicoccus fontis Kam940]|uniref:Uncharacterized protein n=1 Tax=Fervidicoccus fontis (strain DSM 19380 / JCM 18336 / VKM B-2539 / Kam940) TaxID=1163730 RepID=I0A2U9_FERFK|nr:hypothetical protein FFONT_1318 [Fervidicoccus fontis Kam940]
MQRMQIMRVRTEHKAIELFQRSRKVSELLIFSVDKIPIFK